MLPSIPSIRRVRARHGIGLHSRPHSFSPPLGLGSQDSALVRPKSRLRAYD